MTKVMTLLVAAENLPDLDATFTMTQAIIDPLYLAGASMAGYVNGETVTMRDLLYGAVVHPARRRRRRWRRPWPEARKRSSP